MAEPLVTIITPTYNCEGFIGETIRSVLEQEYSDLQYIVIDDGSTDGTWGMLGKLGKVAKVVRHNRNWGEQQTVNEGLRMVEGRYFMVVNADDPLLPKAVPPLVEFMERHPDVLVAYPDWNSINEDGSFRLHIKTREYDFAYMVRHHTCLPSVGSMFRSEVIKLIGYRDTSFHWLGDFDYWLRIGLAGKMARVPATLATWRHRDGQESSVKSDARAREHVGMMDKFYSLPGLPQYLMDVEREARCWSYLVAAFVCKSKRWLLAYLGKAVAIYPKLLFSLESYDMLARQASYILRR